MTAAFEIINYNNYYVIIRIIIIAPKTMHYIAMHYIFLFCSLKIGGTFINHLFLTLSSGSSHSR